MFDEETTLGAVLIRVVKFFKNIPTPENLSILKEDFLISGKF
jgi:hypothetical protein